MQGRTIVLTGVTRGLGLALARRLAAGGHQVLGCGRTAAQVAALQTELGSPHQIDAVDVSDAAQVQRWAATLLAQHGAPQLLINNAALINRSAPLWQVPAAEFEQVVDVNLKGPVNLIRALVPAMIAAGRGVIVNLSSGWGRSVDADVAPYCATKWGIEGLSRALAAELPAGLACVALNPGIVHTEMLESCFGDNAASYPTPEQWVDAAVALLLRLGPRDNGRALTVPQ